ncbi:MAG: nucleotidyltransferase family protein [Anaerolineales bacterium]
MSSRTGIHKRIQEIQGELKSLGVKSLSLFGSASRGEASQKSDLDFLIDFESPYTFDRYMEVKILLEDLFDCDVDLVTPDAVRPEMKDHVEKDLYRVA